MSLSARLSSRRGTAMRSAFAILSLMTSSNSVGSVTGDSPGSAPLRQRNDLFLPRVEKSIGTDDKRTNAMQRHIGKRPSRPPARQRHRKQGALALDARSGRKACYVGFESLRQARVVEVADQPCAGPQFEQHPGACMRVPGVAKLMPAQSACGFKRLLTKPIWVASDAVANTTGIVAVAAVAASAGHRSPDGDNHRHVPSKKISRQFWQSPALTVRMRVFDGHLRLLRPRRERPSRRRASKPGDKLRAVASVISPAASRAPYPGQGAMGLSLRSGLEGGSRPARQSICCVGRPPATREMRLRSAVGEVCGGRYATKNPPRAAVGFRGSLR